MSETTITKLALAQRQLETAIRLFVSRRDRVLAITLAGAADGILHGLVLAAGGQPFAEYAMVVHEVYENKTPAKSAFARHIKDTMFINTLKHMDPGDPLDVTLDIDISAYGAIIKAIANHRELVPEDPPYVQAMLAWSYKYFSHNRITEDDPSETPAGEALIAAYNARPEKLKQREAKWPGPHNPLRRNQQRKGRRQKSDGASSRQIFPFFYLAKENAPSS